MRKGLSGGVKSGPPPKRGPNPQGIKLKNVKKQNCRGNPCVAKRVNVGATLVVALKNN